MASVEVPRLGAAEEGDTHVDFSWANLTYKVFCETEVEKPDGTRIRQKAWKKLLSGVTGTARGGRVMAVMGPSGAGKTTLLNALAGRLALDDEHIIGGCAYLNSTVLTNEHKRSMAFVTQDDILMPRESPREALYLSCRLRLGCDHEEALRRADITLERLRIKDKADCLLGTLSKERKRTNIGQELITNPLVMFVDEATTGLDSVSALRIGETLRELAHSLHRTVICTIHCPSSALYQVFDDILLLAKGHVVYHGPVPEAVPYFAGVGYPLPEQTNPSEYFMKLLQLPDEQLNPLIDAWQLFCQSDKAGSDLSISLMPTSVRATKEDPVLKRAVENNGATLLTQFQLLFWRSVRNQMRDPRSTFGRGAQAIFLSIIIGLFFLNMKKDPQGVQDRLGVLSLLSISKILVGGMNGIVAFPAERAVFLMESSNDAYNPWVYYVAKLVAEIPVQTLWSIIFACICYFMMDLVATAEAFFIALFIVVSSGNCGYAFGILLSAFFPKAEVAMTIAPLVIMPMILVSGLFANTDRLEPTFIWITRISFLRYAFMAMCKNEFGKVGSMCPQGQRCQYSTGDEVLKFLGFDDYGWGLDMLALYLIILFMEVSAAASLAYQGFRLRANLKFAPELGSPSRLTADSPSGHGSVGVAAEVSPQLYGRGQQGTTE